MLHADLLTLLYELDEREMLAHHAEQVATAGANTLNPVRRLNNALALALARAAQGDLLPAIAEIERLSLKAMDLALGESHEAFPLRPRTRISASRLITKVTMKSRIPKVNRTL